MNNALIFNCGQDEDISYAQFLSSKYGIAFACVLENKFASIFK
jgi:hypothetical protein